MPVTMRTFVRLPLFFTEVCNPWVLWTNLPVICKGLGISQLLVAEDALRPAFNVLFAMLIELGSSDIGLIAHVTFVDPPGVRMKPHVHFEGISIPKGF